MREMGNTAGVLNEELFENIFNYAVGGIAIISTKGEWIRINDSIVSQLGYSKEELYKKTFQDITHRDDLSKDLNLMGALLRDEISNYEIEKRYFHKNGTVIWALLSVSLIRDSNGTPKYFISQIRDISQQKKDREELEVMLNVTKEQNSKLSNFADIITHNLRTHSSNLTALMGFITEENEDSDLTKSENFGYLKESVANLNETVNHLTEISKIKSLKAEDVKALNLYAYASQAIYNVSGLAKHSSCSIINEINKDHFLWAIPAYLDSIILNFLTNAIKYRSNKRQPIINLYSEVEDDFVALHIQDNGIGIDLEQFGSEIFKMYKTFHKHKDARGVGLFITKNHIEYLGGKVSVISKVDQGTTFSVYLKKCV